MSTLRVNTIQTNTTSGIDVNSPLETVPSLDVTGNVTVGSNISVSGIVTAGTFSGNLTGNVTSSGVTTIATLNATSIVGVSTAGITTAYVGSINDGPIAGTRNKIINGAMEISQRGTTFAAIGTGIYGLDRWRWTQAGVMVCTVSQSTDVPNNTFQNSYKVDVTTADTSIAAAEFSAIQQFIEGYNVRDLIGRTFTLSFWVKSPKTGVHCVAFRNEGPAQLTDRSYVLEYTVSSANTWEYKTISVAGGLITDGTWNWTNGRGLIVDFVLAMGSTFHTTPGSWNSGIFIATSNQVNVMDNTANDFFLTGVQLEPGTVATPFERRSYGQELALCQRYYQKSYDQNVVPASNDSTGCREAISNGAGYFSESVTFPVVMRAAPTITIYTPTGTVSSLSVGATVGSSGFFVTQSGGTTNSANRFHYAASIEL
jgi:hypothetical protein